MYVHLGQDYIVKLSSIIGIFDMDTSTTSKYTRFSFAHMEKEEQVINAFEDLPRTAVLCHSDFGNQLYLSQISSAALVQRVQKAAACEFT